MIEAIMSSHLFLCTLSVAALGWLLYSATFFNRNVLLFLSGILSASAIAIFIVTVVDYNSDNMVLDSVYMQDIYNKGEKYSNLKPIAKEMMSDGKLTYAEWHKFNAMVREAEINHWKDAIDSQR